MNKALNRQITVIHQGEKVEEEDDNEDSGALLQKEKMVKEKKEKEIQAELLKIE